MARAIPVLLVCLAAVLCCAAVAHAAEDSNINSEALPVHLPASFVEKKLRSMRHRLNTLRTSSEHNPLVEISSHHEETGPLMLSQDLDSQYPMDNSMTSDPSSPALSSPSALVESKSSIKRRRFFGGALGGALKSGLGGAAIGAGAALLTGGNVLKGAAAGGLIGAGASLVGGALGLGKPSAPGAPAPGPAPAPAPTPFVMPSGPAPPPARPTAPKGRMPEDVEDCVACRYIWLQVEMDVGNSQIEENIYDSFYNNCLEAQKAPIFYPACQTMFDSIDDMIADYMDGYTVNQMCENSLLCR